MLRAPFPPPSTPEFRFLNSSPSLSPPWLCGPSLSSGSMRGGIPGFILSPSVPTVSHGSPLGVQGPLTHTPAFPTSLVLGTPPPLPGWPQTEDPTAQSVLCSQTPSCIHPSSPSISLPPPDSDLSPPAHPILTSLPTTSVGPGSSPAGEAERQRSPRGQVPGAGGPAGSPDFCSALCPFFTFAL